MSKAEENLKAILDLLAEWREENGIGYVNMHIAEDGYGLAYDFDGNESRFQIRTEYKPYIANSPTVAAAREPE